jgi:cell division protein FtsW
MRTREKKVDKFFLITLFILLIIGVAMFVSASLGVLVKNKDIFYSILFSQLVLGLGGGLFGMYLALRIDYKIWRKYAFYIFLGAILLTASVFLPNVGWSHGGAERWIKLGPVSFQPVEILKFSFVIYFAAWLSWMKNKVENFKSVILPFIIMFSIVAVVLLKQPDTKSLILIFVTGVSMLFISNVPIKYLVFLFVGSALLFGALVTFTPYLKERVKTFIDPSQNSQSSSYQIQQSYIALGSGGIFGRGYGQSIQKFSYLPEAQGDSIFAVVGEEFGFVGGITVILLYVVFALRGLKIASNSPDMFSRLLVSGIVILITAQSFMHIASVIGVFPLTGVPLVFMSHGGTSLMIYLVAVGIILQVSRKNSNAN